MPRRLRIRPDTTNYLRLREVVDLLLGGGVIAGPTQTFYGLMAAADRADAISRVMKLKGRDRNKPLLLLLDRTDRTQCYARKMPASAKPLIRKFWPGPLTLLMSARPGINQALIGPEGAVGLRVEGLAVIRALVRSLDRAVTGTSANPGGRSPAVTPDEVEAYFGERIDLILDAGRCPGGEPSTMVDVSQGAPRLIRRGALTEEALLAAAPNLRT